MSSFSSLTNRTAVANQGGAMEADTISKHLRSSVCLKGSGKLFLMAVLVMTLCLSVFSTGTVSAQQQKGDMAVAAHLSVGTAGVGGGANFRYNVSAPIRLQGLFTIYASNAVSLTVNGEEILDKSTKWWDAIVNMHYVFSTDTEKKFVPYMIAGLGLLTKGDGSLPVVNIGVGGDFKLSSNFALNAELKIRAVAPFTLGVMYNF